MTAGANAWRVQSLIELEASLIVSGGVALVGLFQLVASVCLFRSHRALFAWPFFILFGICTAGNLAGVWGFSPSAMLDFALTVWLWPSALAFVLSIPCVYSATWPEKATPAA